MLKSQFDLSGEWTLYYEENRKYKKLGMPVTTEEEAKRLIPNTVPAEVPGNFELDLMRAGVIREDPYFGTNILGMQQYENLHLWYTKTFPWEGGADEYTYLRFEGIDTVAEIYLNGELLGRASNMFMPHEFPVPELREGENEIVVHIIPAVIAAREYDIPVSSNAQTYNYESLYLRKSASMFGWDIMPRIVSGGLWKGVSVIKKKPNRIEDMFLYTLSVGESGADIMGYFTLHIEEDFLTDFVLRVHGTCGDSEFTMEKMPLHTNGRMQAYVPNAKLWYPKNAGDPNLYDCEIELLQNGVIVDTMKKRLGIRTVSLSRTSTTDEQGSGDFCFVINGRRVFAMGTNWVPLDAFPSRQKARIDKTFEMVKDINCNIIRLWGGNVYEDEHLYDLCDEAGVMIWQDFGMGCAVYPQEKKFLDMLEPEIVHIVKKYRGHAALVLWAGDNECDYAFDWAGTKRDPNQNIITRELLPRLLRAHDFTRPFLPSSPYVDKAAYESQKPISEDHLWGPRDYFKGGYYKHTVCHFASETGYHGCPSPAALEKFLPKDVIWPIFDETGTADDAWYAHATAMSGKKTDPYAYRIPLMDNQVKTLFTKYPDNIRDFALLSQISQGEAKKYFIERFRITRGRRNGIIWWNLIDGWPEISDSIVDYSYTKKLAYHFVKRAQEPILLAFDEPTENETRMTLYGINDTTKPVHVSYTVRCLTDGRDVASAEGYLPAEKSSSLITVDITPDEQKFYYIEWTADNGEEKVSGRSHYFTHLLKIDADAYIEALKKAGMCELEGF